MRTKLVFTAPVLLALLLSTGCRETGDAQEIAQSITGGNAKRGVAALAKYGCGSCHLIPGVSGAQGLVGPSLSGIASRVYIAGVLQNTPPNMVRWLENPPAVDEHTVMPNMGVTHQDAVDMSGYLYSLK